MVRRWTSLIPFLVVDLIPSSSFSQVCGRKLFELVRGGYEEREGEMRERDVSMGTNIKNRRGRGWGWGWGWVVKNFIENGSRMWILFDVCCSVFIFSLCLLVVGCSESERKQRRWYFEFSFIFVIWTFSFKCWVSIIMCSGGSCCVFGFMFLLCFWVYAFGVMFLLCSGGSCWILWVRVLVCWCSRWTKILIHVCFVFLFCTNW